VEDRLSGISSAARLSVKDRLGARPYSPSPPPAEVQQQFASERLFNIHTQRNPMCSYDGVCNRPYCKFGHTVAPKADLAAAIVIAKPVPAFGAKAAAVGSGAAAGAAPQTVLAAGATAGPTAEEKQAALEERQAADLLSVYVTGLHKAVDEEALDAHFKECGTIVRSHVKRDPVTSWPKGAAYIQFETAEARELAIAKSESVLRGKPVMVIAKQTFVSANNNRGRGRGRGRGGGRGGMRGVGGAYLGRARGGRRGRSSSYY
jgi:hypothetical protein